MFTDAHALLASLVGTWSGTGRGRYPTIEPFGYRETMVISGDPSRMLTWEQRTTSLDGSRPMHRETGHLRILDDGTLEAVVAQPTGVAEVHVGRVIGSARPGDVLRPDPESDDEPPRTRSLDTVELESVTVALTPTAKPVTRVVRRWRLVDPHTSDPSGDAAGGTTGATTGGRPADASGDPSGDTTRDTSTRLVIELDMAAMGLDPTVHLEAVLIRQASPA